MKETVTVPFDRYRTPDGEPTCAANFGSGEACCFCRVRKFGMIDCCNAVDKDLQRSKDGTGYLIPADGCPLWREVK